MAIINVAHINLELAENNKFKPKQWKAIALNQTKNSFDMCWAMRSTGKFGNKYEIVINTMDFLPSGKKWKMVTKQP